MAYVNHEFLACSTEAYLFATKFPARLSRNRTGKDNFYHEGHEDHEV